MKCKDDEVKVGNYCVNKKDGTIFRQLPWRKRIVLNFDELNGNKWPDTEILGLKKEIEDRLIRHYGATPDISVEVYKTIIPDKKSDYEERLGDNDFEIRERYSGGYDNFEPFE